MNKKGRMIIYCAECNKYIIVNEKNFNWVCSECGNPMTTMRCSRCGAKWRVRATNVMPSVCANPKCHSPYWNRERVRDRKTGKYIPVDKKKN